MGNVHGQHVRQTVADDIVAPQRVSVALRLAVEIVGAMCCHPDHPAWITFQDNVARAPRPAKGAGRGCGPARVLVGAPEYRLSIGEDGGHGKS